MRSDLYWMLLACYLIAERWGWKGMLYACAGWIVAAFLGGFLGAAWRDLQRRRTKVVTRQRWAQSTMPMQRRGDR